MGFFKNLMKKKEFIYIVDVDTLKEFIRRDVDFSVANNLVASEDVLVYLNGNEYDVTSWNYELDDDEDDNHKGLVYCFDENEYSTLDELFDRHFRCVTGYFKIELVNTDDEFLNNYMNSHPELKIEDYQ